MYIFGYIFWIPCACHTCCGYDFYCQCYYECLSKLTWLFEWKILIITLLWSSLLCCANSWSLHLNLHLKSLKKCEGHQEGHIVSLNCRIVQVLTDFYLLEVGKGEFQFCGWQIIYHTTKYLIFEGKFRVNLL